MGAGKTTWTRHLLRGLGVSGPIKSPSYTVLEAYDTAFGNVAHFDFYRFRDPQEWEDAGFRDVYASPGLKLAEWPDKAMGLLPKPDLIVRWMPPAPSAPMPQPDSDASQRWLRYEALSPLGVRLLAGLEAPANVEAGDVQ